MKIIDFLKQFTDGFLNVLFPVKCYCCGELTKNNNELCSSCREGLEYINPDKRCKDCGKEKDSCDCNLYVHRYKEMLAVFRYEGNAKRIMLNYKMNDKRHYADFFYKEMALCISREYGNYPIDTVCFVPSGFNSLRKRGYNQSKLIAKKIAKLFNFDLDASLKVKRHVRTQHRSKSRGERMQNARYKYRCNGDMTGKTVLLIDDIATTGATLDDCTRALLFAGAKDVYCCVAMITSIKKEKTEKR